MEKAELERLAGVMRREAALHWAMAKAGPLVDPFELELNAERLRKAADLRAVADHLEDEAQRARRAHLQVVK